MQHRSVSSRRFNSPVLSWLKRNAPGLATVVERIATKNSINPTTLFSGVIALILVVGMVAAVGLVQVNQDLRQQAFSGPYPFEACVQKQGNFEQYDRVKTSCEKGGGTWTDVKCSCSGGSTASSTGIAPKVSVDAGIDSGTGQIFIGQGTPVQQQSAIGGYAEAALDLYGNYEVGTGCGGQGEFPCTGGPGIAANPGNLQPQCNQGYEIDETIGTCIARGTSRQQAVVYGACLNDGDGKSEADCEQIAFGGQEYLNSPQAAVTELCVDYLEQNSGSANGSLRQVSSSDVSRCQSIAQILVGGNEENPATRYNYLSGDGIVTDRERAFMDAVEAEIRGGGDQVAQNANFQSFMDGCYTAFTGIDIKTDNYIGQARSGEESVAACNSYSEDRDVSRRQNSYFIGGQEEANYFFALVDNCSSYARSQGYNLTRQDCIDAAIDEGYNTRQFGADNEYYQRAFAEEETRGSRFQGMGERLANCLTYQSADACDPFYNVDEYFIDQCKEEFTVRLKITDEQCETVFALGDRVNHTGNKVPGANAADVMSCIDQGQPAGQLIYKDSGCTEPGCNTTVSSRQFNNSLCNDVFDELDVDANATSSRGKVPVVTANITTITQDDIVNAQALVDQFGYSCGGQGQVVCVGADKSVKCDPGYVADGNRCLAQGGTSVQFIAYDECVRSGGVSTAKCEALIFGDLDNPVNQVAQECIDRGADREACHQIAAANPSVSGIVISDCLTQNVKTLTYCRGLVASAENDKRPSQNDVAEAFYLCAKRSNAEDCLSILDQTNITAVASTIGTTSTLTAAQGAVGSSLAAVGLQVASCLNNPLSGASCMGVPQVTSLDKYTACDKLGACVAGRTCVYAGPNNARKLINAGAQCNTYIPSADYLSGVTSAALAGGAGLGSTSSISTLASAAFTDTACNPASSLSTNGAEGAKCCGGGAIECSSGLCNAAPGKQGICAGVAAVSTAGQSQEATTAIAEEPPTDCSKTRGIVQGNPSGGFVMKCDFNGDNQFGHHQPTAYITGNEATGSCLTLCEDPTADVEGEARENYLVSVQVDSGTTSAAAQIGQTITDYVGCAQGATVPDGCYKITGTACVETAAGCYRPANDEEAAEICGDDSYDLQLRCRIAEKENCVQLAATGCWISKSESEGEDKEVILRSAPEVEAENQNVIIRVMNNVYQSTVGRVLNFFQGLGSRTSPPATTLAPAEEATQNTVLPPATVPTQSDTTQTQPATTNTTTFGEFRESGTVQTIISLEEIVATRDELDGGVGLTNGEPQNNGEMQVETLCPQGSHADTRNGEWVCLNDEDEITRTYTSSDYADLCTRTYGVEAIAIQSGTKDNPAYNWLCYPVSDN